MTEVDVDDIVHITEVRAELEGYAAELAALRMDAGAAGAPRRCSSEVEGLGRGGPRGADGVDRRVHRFMGRRGNPYLVDTLERYFSLSLRIWYVVLDRVPGLGPRCTTRASCSAR